MAWNKFGSSWFGVIFNPVGYMAQRESPSKAALEYAADNPPSALITLEDTEISFREDASRWVSACASKLKSDDVGKSLANANKACQAVFYNDPSITTFQSTLAERNEQDRQATQARITEGVKNFLIIIGAALAVALLVYLFTSK